MVGRTLLWWVFVIAIASNVPSCIFANVIYISEREVFVWVFEEARQSGTGSIHAAVV
jgi:hypothetical protein